jgi:hypothetical protein
VRTVPGGVRKVGKQRPLKGTPPLPFATGTVVNAHDGSFTVVMRFPIQGTRRIRVTTSSATKVLTDATASLSQLHLGVNVVALGRIGHHGVLMASTVTEPALVHLVVGPGLVRLRPSGCSASAITTAVILAGG